jgi:hypothetical protein
LNFFSAGDVFFAVRAFAAALSTRTPLEFLCGCFLFPGAFQGYELTRVSVALCPGARAAQSGFVCERFFTAPLRALSPVGLLTAIFAPFRC